ncbi:MAG: TetR/AcrR family transcriptional regulator [Pseudomonadota bacterium]
MVRTRTFDRDDTLRSVMRLFTSKGYAETSMEDIVKATGVSRYGLYSTFGNKRELFEQALERYADSMGRQSFLRLLEPDASVADIRAIFEERIDALFRGGKIRGCLLCNTAMEVAPHDDGIEEVLQRFMKRISKAFAIGLETAKARGDVAADLDAHSASDHLTSTLFGLVVLARSGFSESRLRSVVDDTVRSLEALPA